ncbi:MAG: hypothetical protein WAX07_07640 [Candidatus Altiarchaeia archaeon]
MSGYKFHIIAYLLAACALTYALKEYRFLELTLFSLILSLFIGGIYSILPDIDLPSSVVRRMVERGALALILFLIIAYVFYPVMPLIYAAIALTFMLLLLWYLKHRGFFHTILAGLLLAAPWALLDPVYSLYAFLGYAAHLFADGELFSLF